MMKKWLLPVFASFMIMAGTGTDTAEAASQKELTATAYKYIGVPYAYGGTTSSGLDCSGFTQLVFKQLDIPIQRTTSGQYSQGTSVSKSNLQVGDLVFFNTTGKPTSHVGIYVGNNKFTHAGTSTGVITASLSESYWAKRYTGAKRIASFTNGTENAADEVKDAAVDFSYYASRGEVALQLAKALNLDTSNTNSSFIDIKSNSKYAGATTALKKIGVFSGDENGKFNANSPLTRAEMAKVLVKAFDLQMQSNTLTFSDVKSSHWAAKDIKNLASNKITVGQGDGTFGVNDSVKLVDLSAFIDRAKNK
ncbi:C40 family peptidase [Lysinibacillus sp. 54212]|uniref:C40 family peptidase n=1 Tax=Lysinibacillus sp. 54212 TaxID=3119829 RepID=UPI002FCC68AD